jgi:hypothetical protein
MLSLHSQISNRRPHGAISAVQLLYLFLVLVVTAGTVMLVIQMHLIHVHISTFSSSVDRYVHQLHYQHPQQHQENKHNVYVAKVTSKTTAKSRVEVDSELEPLLNILRHAGYAEEIFDSKFLARLPKWSDIMKTYGPPKILGFDTCVEFRNTINPRLQTMGVAGAFNSGTNLLDSLLKENCRNRDVVWQVRPWQE